MEDTNEVTSEVETLDGEDTQAETRDTTEPKLYTEEEVEAIRKKMQSDSDKGVQPLLKKQKAFDAVLANLTSISEDSNKLIDLYEDNEEAAKIILERYYNGMSIDEFKQSIQYQEDYTDPKAIERRIELETQKRLDKITLEKAKEAFIEKLSINDSDKKDFEEAFAERMQLKSFRIEDVGKHLEKAYREIAKEEDFKTLHSQETIARVMATGEGRGGGQDTKAKGGLQNELSAFLKSNLNY